MSTWSTEVDMLARIADLLQSLRYTIVMVSQAKAKLEPPKPMQRPVTAFDRVRHKTRKEKHEALADRILLRRRKSAD